MLFWSNFAMEQGFEEHRNFWKAIFELVHADGTFVISNFEANSKKYMAKSSLIWLELIDGWLPIGGLNKSIT